MLRSELNERFPPAASEVWVVNAASGSARKKPIWSDLAAGLNKSYPTAQVKHQKPVALCSSRRDKGSIQQSESPIQAMQDAYI